MSFARSRRSPNNTQLSDEQIQQLARFFSAQQRKKLLSHAEMEEVRAKLLNTSPAIDKTVIPEVMAMEQGKEIEQESKENKAPSFGCN